MVPLTLDGKVALITGGSNGIGEGVARHLAGRGAQVVLADIDETRGKAVADEITPGHHPVVFGMVGGVLGWDALEMTHAYLYSTSAALVGAALRLLPLGQLAGQHIVWNVQPLIAELAAAAQNKREDDIWSFAPALEIAGMRHARLDARLFRS